MILVGIPENKSRDEKIGVGTVISTKTEQKKITTIFILIKSLSILQIGKISIHSLNSTLKPLKSVLIKNRVLFVQWKSE